jgi:hypothetical protein
MPEDPALRPSKYWVVYGKGRKRGRLHLTAGCSFGSRIQVLDGEGYESPVEDIPYTDICAKCFGDVLESEESSMDDSGSL